IYADATEISKTALENVIRSVQSGAPGTDSAPMESAGRIGARRGKVSELTTLLPIKPSAAKRMRAFLELLHGSLGNHGVDRVGTVHDMRFGEVEGWPGIRSPKIKDFIVKHQIPAYFWYVANPNLTVVATKRLEKIGKAVDEFLDKVS